ncbi:MAG: hypothetical protein M3R50_08790 [Bacteroidota bacterium]|nr:hypothetical protein [Bacteroidota bacterium]
MTQKKKNQHHPEHPPVPRIKKEIRKLRIISVAVIFFIIFGLGIAYFANAATAGLIAGGVIGAIAGYFFGHQIVKGLLKS